MFQNQSWKKLTHTRSRFLSHSSFAWFAISVSRFCRLWFFSTPLIDFQTSDAFPCLQKNILWSTIWHCNLINRCIFIDLTPTPPCALCVFIKMPDTANIVWFSFTRQSCTVPVYDVRTLKTLRTMKFNHKMQRHVRNVHVHKSIQTEKTDTGNMFAA